MFEPPGGNTQIRGGCTYGDLSACMCVCERVCFFMCVRVFRSRGADVLERGWDTSEVFLYVHVLQHADAAGLPWCTTWCRIGVSWTREKMMMYISSSSGGDKYAKPCVKLDKVNWRRNRLTVPPAECLNLTLMRALGQGFDRAAAGGRGASIKMFYAHFWFAHKSGLIVALKILKCPLKKKKKKLLCWRGWRKSSLIDKG